MDDDVDDTGNAIQEYNRKYKRFWPLHIYTCQKIDFFGAKMYSVPSFQVHGSRILWVVSYLLLHVEPLWSIIYTPKMRRSKWQVYIMIYLTRIDYLFLIVELLVYSKYLA